MTHYMLTSVWVLVTATNSARPADVPLFAFRSKESCEETRRAIEDVKTRKGLVLTCQEALLENEK